ncbi:MAG: hypothetical protein OEZ59_12100 [Deltaproteobacteria bacterium]|nr:hypothetical protein [Deltaproteobacteria bacterium]
MDAPVKELELLRKLVKEARELLEAGQHADAETRILEAIELEPKAARPMEILADIDEAMGRAELAEQHRLQAKMLRKEAWQKQVEAEIRGKHEMLGEAVRHELL